MVLQKICSSYFCNLLEILASWRKTLQLKDNKNEEDQELIMNLSPAYEQQKEAWQQKGQQEGQSMMIALLLKERFGTLDDELSSLIPCLIKLPLADRTSILFNLSNLSREELLGAISA